MRHCLLALLFVMPLGCKKHVERNTPTVSGRGKTGMRSPFETPHRGNIPGPAGGGSAGGEFNSPGREAQFGTAGMKTNHPQPDGTGWKSGYGSSNGQVHPGKKDFNDDINVEDMTRERGVGNQEKPDSAP